MRTKIVVVVLLLILFTIFVTQNTLVIPVNIFFWFVQMSVIVLILLSSLIGLIIGFILASLVKAKNKPEPVNIREKGMPPLG